MLKVKPNKMNTLNFFHALAFLFIMCDGCYAQTPSLVDYDTYERIVSEVKMHRSERLINTDKFVEMSKQDNVIILDTRSKEMYDAKHIKGAIHLNFSDFTQKNLEALFESRDVNILIYCNNNFEDDQKYFATKAYVAPVFDKPAPEGSPMSSVTMALNIPTYINLYGYGYKNVFELSELISVFDSRVQLEGTAIGPPK
ncbi:MAG: rhodanese-like domain-containing protein [Crocinitomicaceae bacterium]|nr:rhodanese-like domain-containing protein [Crocinitomicaceae bacterium]